jgi:predicted Zn-dependent protease
LFARIALLAAAVAVVVWLVVSLHAARLQARAEESASGDSVASRIDMLDRAARLTSSTEPEVREAQILVQSGRVREAARILRDVARREPENREAWAGLAQVLLDDDPRGAARARRRLAELVPPVSQPDQGDRQPR